MPIYIYSFLRLVQQLTTLTAAPSHLIPFSSVTQSCPTLCDPMNHSTPGLPVHHQLPEFTQTHVHRVGDAIQLSHPVIAYWAPTELGSSSFSILSFCLFMLFMRFSRQEYWSGLHSFLQWTTFCQTSPPRPGHLAWPHTAWLSFIELDKAVVHLSSGHRTGNGQFSFQSQRKAMPKNAQTTAQLHSSYTLVK